MNGQKYTIGDPTITSDITVNTSGSPVDLVAITAAAAVAIYLAYFQLNCAVNAAQIQKLAVVLRSSAGSGAGGSLGVRNKSPAGPAASLTANYLVATPGALSGSPAWSDDWQQFGPFEFDRRDDPFLIPAGLTWAICAPTITAGFTMNPNGEVTECK